MAAICRNVTCAASNLRTKVVDGLQLEFPGNSKADLGPTLGRHLPGAGRGTNVLRLIRPRAAAQHAPGAISACARCAISRKPDQIFLPAILDPFADVAVHVEQPERIGLA